MTIPFNAVYPVATIRAIDRAAIASGIAGYDLMTRAAQASLTEIRRHYPDCERLLLLCGPGNNGGDGYVLARLAMMAGMDVDLFAFAPPANLGGDAQTAWHDFVDAGGVTQSFRGQLPHKDTLIVDALFGSGLSRPIEGAAAEAIQAANRHSAKVVALDIPSGLDGDSGYASGVTIAADLTVTFVGLKPGLFLEEGPRLAGTVRLAQLDIADEHYAQAEPEFRIVDDAALRQWLPPRPRRSNKGDFGSLLVIGGGKGMPGAAQLCGLAALRCGAGKVRVATHPDHAGSLAAACPELMVSGIGKASDLGPLLSMANVVAIGPGLGQDDWASEMLDAASKVTDPMVWDADALNLLAAQSQDTAKPENRIVTPHPGEAGRLLGIATAAIEADRSNAVGKLQSQYGGVAVLKGSGTLTATGDGVAVLCGAGNPGMATAGMGDVLTGVIASLLAQRLPMQAAAVLGVEIHARAGDIAARQGERGLLASDVIDALRVVVNPDG